jgi:phosphoribosyl-ATP pyrophosphohydrolase/phosphoribosyl-AMP cyclohydrolase/histidinol dehydrogenase
MKLVLLQGYAVVVADLEEGIRVSDAVAPEHLELQVAIKTSRKFSLQFTVLPACVQVADADAVWRRLAHYGGLFIGSHSAEVFGDYGVGPNHVLPTSGTARYTGGLSVFTFLRVRTWMRSAPAPALAGGEEDKSAADAALKEVVHDSAALAELEGLYGHAAAARARLTA